MSIYKNSFMNKIKIEQRPSPVREQPGSRGVRGVASVQPYIVGKGTASVANGHMEDVWVIGSDPDSMLGSAWGFVEGSRADLRRPYGVSFDEVDSEKLGHPGIGDWSAGHGVDIRHTGGLTAASPGGSDRLGIGYGIDHHAGGFTGLLLGERSPYAKVNI